MDVLRIEILLLSHTSTQFIRNSVSTPRRCQECDEGEIVVPAVFPLKIPSFLGSIVEPNGVGLALFNFIAAADHMQLTNIELDDKR